MEWTVSDIINLVSLLILIGLLIHGRRFNNKWDNAIKDMRTKLNQGKKE